MTDDGADDPAQDELAIGRDRRPLPRRRVLLGAAGVAVIAVAAVVAVRSGSDDRHHPATRSSHPSTPAVSATPTGATVTYARPGTCDVISGSGLSCSIIDRVPTQVVAALRTVLPNGVLVPSPITVTGPGPRVLNRHVAASAGGRTVEVDVLSTGQRLAATTSAAGTQRRQIVVDNGDHSVTVTFFAPTALPSSATLIRLAQDPRLLLPGG